jgi:phosphoglycerate dehydrogenase-like enzyme
MRVLAYDPQRAEKRHTGGAKLHLRFISELGELLEEADIVSLHVPLTQQTHHMIGQAELDYMRPGSYLVNTSRAGVVDERALLAALANGTLAGAGIDGFEGASAGRRNRLLTVDNVCATPHIALATSEALARLACDIARNVLMALDGQMPAHVMGATVDIEG